MASATEASSQTQSLHRPKFKIKDSNLNVRESTSLMYGLEKDPDSFPDGGSLANMVVFGSFCGLIADFGIANSLGAIESYVSTNQLLNVDPKSVSWVFSVHLGVMYFGGVFFGQVFDTFGARIPLLAGTLVMCTGLFCTAESRTLWQFILSFSILTALGTSLAMSPLIGALSHWFLKKRAIACSVATVGGLLGGTIFPVMLQNLYGRVGYKWAIRILSFICLACMLVAILLVKERKPTAENPTAEHHRHPTGLSSLSALFKDSLDFSALKDIKFLSLTLAVFLAETISVTTLTYLASYALSYGLTQSQAFLLLTVVNVSGIPSRLILGVLADKYGRFNVMIFSSLLTTVVVFGLWMPAAGHTAILFAFAVLFGVSTSAVISLIGACTGQICSAEQFGKYYGFVYFQLGFLTILVMYLLSLVIGDGLKSSYRNFVAFEGCLSAGSVVAWLFAKYANVGMRMAAKF